MMVLVVVLLCGMLPSMMPGASRGLAMVQALRRNVDVAADGSEDYEDEDEYEVEGEEFDDEYYDEEWEGGHDPVMHDTYAAPDRRAIYEAFANDEETTMMWSLVDQDNLEGLKSMIAADPELVHIRSEDGRGPLFWAYEYGHKGIVEFLISAGASETAKDTTGHIPSDLQGKDGRASLMDEDDDEDDDEYEDDD